MISYICESTFRERIAPLRHQPTEHTMPANKNAVIRYQILDELLSDRHHYYTRKDLCDKCNQRLIEKGYPEVSKRTIEFDLHDIETELGMAIDWSFVKDGKHIVRYEDQSKSIFTKKLSDEEVLFLSEVLNTLGQFSGLDSFEWLDALQERLKLEAHCEGRKEEDRRTIISFSRNPYLNNEAGNQVSNALAGFFSAIANKVVVNVEYRKFGQTNSAFYDVYPYLLKQYSNRWYLICQLVNAERDFLMNLPLDRIFAFKEVPDIPFRECYCDINERYDDIVGVTYLENLPIEDILFAVSKRKAPYITTKPIHGSQAQLPEQEQKKLRKRYPELEEYIFFKIECIPNNELKEIFFSFDKDIVVLHEGLRKEICDEMERQIALYRSLKPID